MVRFCLFASFCLEFFVTSSFAQKPAIDTGALGTFSRVGTPIISGDGEVACFQIINKPFHSQTLVVVWLSNNDSIEIANANQPYFSNDSKKLVFFKTKDSLGILSLGDSTIEYITKVGSFKVPDQGIEQWIAYQLKDTSNKMVLRNLITGQQQFFFSVEDYTFSNDGQILIAKTKIDDLSEEQLAYVELRSSKVVQIWKGQKAGRPIFGTGNEIAFFAEEKDFDQVKVALWSYKEGDARAKIIVDENSSKIFDSLPIALTDDQHYFQFSNRGETIFFNLVKRKNSNTILNVVSVDIWSYSDPKLQSKQLTEIQEGYSGSYVAGFNINTHEIFLLSKEYETPFFNGISDQNIILQACIGDLRNEWNWNNSAHSTIYLVSTKDGNRQEILGGAFPPTIINSITISPKGKFVLFYNPAKANFYSYEISSKILRNITENIDGRWTRFDKSDQPDSSFRPLGIAAFSEDDSTILIYERNDIFQINLAKKRPAINLTNGEGRRSNLVFRFALDQNLLKRTDNKLLLSGFNTLSKKDGFYLATLGVISNPKLLVSENCVFNGPEIDEVRPFHLVKARNSEAYLLRKMSSQQSENYFVTSNFKTFLQISNVHPERNFNWLTSELVAFKTFDGKFCQGILYKPENFDSKKKYPLIICYYERVSDNLNKFTTPEFSDGPINIPFFVSNGYLVFTPDIFYIIGSPGRSAFNSVVASAKWLSTYSWVDKNRIGLQGHSFGGFETNYIVTHTNVFAAAMSSSGMSDFVSAYGSIIGDGGSRQRVYELYRDRIGGTLWQRTNQYIENSPVLNANKVVTPVLMMNNKNDADVPFAQGVEFFTALRRLEKRSWMLQYDGEDHILSSRASKDLTSRMLQFFDHYLKEFPPPIWMTKGIPACKKGIETGFEYDLRGKCGTDCFVCRRIEVKDFHTGAR